jgi:DNA-binding transcriptional MerR regulator
VLTVRKIRVLLDAGLPTEVIRSVLPCTRDDRPEFDWCADIRDLLERELTDLDVRIEGLQRNRGALAGFLAQPGGPSNP